MPTYKLINEHCILRVVGDVVARISTFDTPALPNTNPDYLAYKQWLAAGGVPEPADPVAPEVPTSVTRRQAKQALLLHGLLGNVQPAIDAIPDATQRAMIQIEWDDSQVFERNRPALIALGAALGLTNAQLDALFIEAAQL